MKTGRIGATSSQVGTWEIENGGGHCEEVDVTIRLWSNSGEGWINLYREFAPSSDFNFSLEVKATRLQGFALMLRDSLPFFGSVRGVNFEFGARDGGSFCLARYVNGWTWNVFSSASEDVWYMMRFAVVKSPFHLVAEVFMNSTLVGEFDASDMTNISFETIRYIGFGIWPAGGEFYVKNIIVPGGEVPRTWIVDDDGLADFHTIQEAIDASGGGDTVFVREGTYSGPIVIDRSLTLQGEDKNLTIINGGSNEPSGSIVLVTADNVKISNFTIQHCRSGGNAIWLDNYVNATISDNIITDNSDGIRILRSSGNIISNNIIKNNPYNTGLGFNWAYNNTVYGNILFNNNVGIGGNFWNNTFFNNTIKENKGGWACWGISDNFHNCVFFHNNIINNGRQVVNSYADSLSIWDDGYPSGGNYWSDYTGVDADGDGIGDTPYTIDEENIDHYPLIMEYPPPLQPLSPIADFTWSPLTPVIDEQITFDASPSKNGWNGTHSTPISTYSWSFGDNETAEGQNVAHSYAALGIYIVQLNVTDTQGLWNATQRQIQVGQPHGPTAMFSVSPEIAHVGQTIQLNASASLSGWNGTHEKEITVYLWNFGDDHTNSSADNTMTHAYSAAGIFNITLTVTDAQNMNSSFVRAILVTMPTSVSISTSSATTIVGFAININGALEDSHGNGIEGEPVVLYYTFPGITTWFPMTSMLTDSTGGYSAQWIPTATGTFQIKSEWAGNTTHSGASKNVTLTSIPAMNQYIFSVESNSTVASLAFNTTNWELSFSASGPSGTTGYVRVTVAKSIIFDIANIRVYLDDVRSQYSIESVGDSWLLTFDYSHSTHKFVIDLDITIVPEYISTVQLFAFLVVLMVFTLAIKRTKRQTSNASGRLSY